MLELVRLYSNPDVRDIVAHAAQAVTHVKLDHSAPLSLAARRRWRLVDRLGEQIIRELLTDSRAGTPQRELAERYGISVSSVKRILHH
jgi:Trp operon repressor